MNQPHTDVLRDQTLGLAAVVQSVLLVDQIARTGQAEPEALEASLNSLFSFSADSTEAALGDLRDFSLGIRGLRDLLSGNDYGERRNVMRYCLGVLHLQRRLSRDSEGMTLLRNRLEHAEKQREFVSNISGMSDTLASIYQDTLSQYRYRIQVNGSAQQLQNPNNAARIRSLLLAGVRGAFLWRQAGGSRWRLIFHRNRYFECAKSLLMAPE
ncbi:high frequency lysogenization protein HflD [Spongiibacter nanhainus]|uniref:High frequency lysogenization protein HflD homolog n=1 Tax=Spongiibacter nanhainus TaxID=2794344 RepID=A0A7T4US60_9GAMM|nr:high frequency lysogenization protein HflD [Spongiibacter nanhainus]QQD20003.1 high frequency lysogenization protein HflD [Spongiibacter nanhainus]